MQDWSILHGLGVCPDVWFRVNGPGLGFQPNELEQQPVELGQQFHELEKQPHELGQQSEPLG